LHAWRRLSAPCCLELLRSDPPFPPVFVAVPLSDQTRFRLGVSPRERAPRSLRRPPGFCRAPPGAAPAHPSHSPEAGPLTAASGRCTRALHTQQKGFHQVRRGNIPSQQSLPAHCGPRLTGQIKNHITAALLMRNHQYSLCVLPLKEHTLSFQIIQSFSPVVKSSLPPTSNINFIFYSLNEQSDRLSTVCSQNLSSAKKIGTKIPVFTRNRRPDLAEARPVISRVCGTTDTTAQRGVNLVFVCSKGRCSPRLWGRLGSTGPSTATQCEQKVQ